MSVISLSQAGAVGGGVEAARLPGGGVSGLYVHVPFCGHKCHYCDFYSITRQSPERMGAFVSRVLAEAGRWVEVRGREEAVETVFFGGGTPSLLPIGEMERLVRGLREVLGLEAGRVNEWTVECNPATVDLEYLQRLRALGVDRLSFGAQSFNPSDLKMLERHHDPDDVPRSLELARRAGFERLNLDLIFGVPGQAMPDWESSLAEGLACGTRHVSAYLLTYEPNTPMAVKKRLGQLVPAEEELEVAMLRRTREVLRGAGLPAYEISNYAAPGEECRHNLMYWHGGSYLGLGPSAASHVHGWRWRNRPHLGEWERAVDAGTFAPAAFEVEQLDAEKREAELGYLMIRTAAGIETARYRAATGRDPRERFSDALAKLAPAGVVEVDEGGIRLTDKGVPVADAVAAELLG